MPDLVYVGTRVSDVNTSPQFDVYSKVIINIDNDTYVVAGNDSGRTLEIDNPFGTQQMAENVLDRLRGYRYQPYEAGDALINPAAEIGDTVETATSYGGLFSRSKTFGRLMQADISAPCDEEVNHEYQFESPSERQYKRQVGDIKASIILTNNRIESEVANRTDAENVLASKIEQTAEAITSEVTRATSAEGALSSQITQTASVIAAKVSASGGDSSSFGWALTSDSHTWYAGNREVMKVTASGLTIKGVVEATGGTIGGFAIGSNALQYNDLDWGDTSKNYGVYIGRSGIQLGQNFSVNNSGAVTAKKLTLRGNITFLNNDGSVAGTMSAANLRSGAASAYNNGSYWSKGAGYGNDYKNATLNNSTDFPDYFTTKTLRATLQILCPGTFVFGGHTVTRKAKGFYDRDGNYQTINYLAWA